MRRQSDQFDLRFDLQMFRNAFGKTDAKQKTSAKQTPAKQTSAKQNGRVFAYDDPRHKAPEPKTVAFEHGMLVLDGHPFEVVAERNVTEFDSGKFDSVSVTDGQEQVKVKVGGTSRTFTLQPNPYRIDRKTLWRDLCCIDDGYPTKLKLDKCTIGWLPASWLDPTPYYEPNDPYLIDGHFYADLLRELSYAAFLWTVGVGPDGVGPDGVGPTELTPTYVNFHNEALTTWMREKWCAGKAASGQTAAASSLRGKVDRKPATLPVRACRLVGTTTATPPTTIEFETNLPSAMSQHAGQVVNFYNQIGKFEVAFVDPKGAVLQDETVRVYTPWEGYPVYRLEFDGEPSWESKSSSRKVVVQRNAIEVVSDTPFGEASNAAVLAKQFVTEHHPNLRIVDAYGFVEKKPEPQSKPESKSDSKSKPVLTAQESLPPPQVVKYSYTSAWASKVPPKLPVIVATTAWASKVPPKLPVIVGTTAWASKVSKVVVPQVVHPSQSSSSTAASNPPTTSSTTNVSSSKLPTASSTTDVSSSKLPSSSQAPSSSSSKHSTGPGTTMGSGTAQLTPQAISTVNSETSKPPASDPSKEPPAQGSPKVCLDPKKQPTPELVQDVQKHTHLRVVPDDYDASYKRIFCVKHAIDGQTFGSYRINDMRPEDIPQQTANEWTEFDHEKNKDLEKFYRSLTQPNDFKFKQDILGRGPSFLHVMWLDMKVSGSKNLPPYIVILQEISRGYGIIFDTERIQVWTGTGKSFDDNTSSNICRFLNSRTSGRVMFQLGHGWNGDDGQYNGHSTAAVWEKQSDGKRFLYQLDANGENESPNNTYLRKILERCYDVARDIVPTIVFNNTTTGKRKGWGIQATGTCAAWSMYILYAILLNPKVPVPHMVAYIVFKNVWRVLKQPKQPRQPSGSEELVDDPSDEGPYNDDDSYEGSYASDGSDSHVSEFKESPSADLESFKQALVEGYTTKIQDHFNEQTSLEEDRILVSDLLTLPEDDYPQYEWFTERMIYHFLAAGWEFILVHWTKYSKFLPKDDPFEVNLRQSLQFYVDMDLKWPEVLEAVRPQITIPQDHKLEVQPLHLQSKFGVQVARNPPSFARNKPLGQGGFGTVFTDGSDDFVWKEQIFAKTPSFVAKQVTLHRDYFQLDKRPAQQRYTCVRPTECNLDYHADLAFYLRKGHMQRLKPEHYEMLVRKVVVPAMKFKFYYKNGEIKSAIKMPRVTMAREILASSYTIDKLADDVRELQQSFETLWKAGVNILYFDTKMNNAGLFEDHLRLIDAGSFFMYEENENGLQIGEFLRTVQMQNERIHTLPQAQKAQDFYLAVLFWDMAAHIHSPQMGSNFRAYIMGERKILQERKSPQMLQTQKDVFVDFHRQITQNLRPDNVTFVQTLTKVLTEKCQKWWTRWP